MGDDLYGSGSTGKTVLPPATSKFGVVPPPPKSKGGYGVPDQRMVDALEEIPRVRSRPTGAKIRPRDYPGVRFSVEAVDRFLNRYEEAAEVEGADGGDMVRQIGNFIPNEEDLRDVEEMDGYEERDWPKLRAEIQEKWGMRRQRFREGDLERLAVEKAEKGGVEERREFDEFVSSFDRILKYLNRNEVIIGTPASVKRSFLKGLSPQVQERVQRRLYNLDLIRRSRDGSSLLPDLKEIREAARAEFDMMELMEETSGSAPQAGQAGGSRRAEPVTQEEVVSLADAVKELRLFVQRSVGKDGPPAERKPFVPGTRPPGQGGPVGTCTYCGVKGHYRSQCADLTADLNAHRVRIWQGDFYFPGSREKIEGIPRDVVRAANPAGPSQSKPDATSASGVVVGAEWCPPVVGAEVRTVHSDERVMFGGLDRMDVDFPKKSKGKEAAGPSAPTPGKKKAAELAKRALGGDSQIALSIKELASVSPMMADELISVIRESAGLKADGNHVSFDVRSGEVEPVVEEAPGLHTDTVSCPLGYVQMCIGDRQVWAMIDSGSMVNLLPTDLVRDADLVRRQANIGLRGIGGHECKVDGVVEGEWVEVAKCKRRVSFLSVQASEVILGRPFLFAFRAGLRYDSARREEILSVVDSRGVRFETTICQPSSGNWEERGRTPSGEEGERRGEKGEAHPSKRGF